MGEQSGHYSDHQMMRSSCGSSGQVKNERIVGAEDVAWEALLEMESVDLVGGENADVAASSVVDVRKAFEKVQLFVV